MREKRFVIAMNLEETEATLSDRAKRIGAGNLPIEPQGIPQI